MRVSGAVANANQRLMCSDVKFRRVSMKRIRPPFQGPDLPRRPNYAPLTGLGAVSFERRLPDMRHCAAQRAFYWRSPREYRVGKAT